MFFSNAAPSQSQVSYEARDNSAYDNRRSHITHPKYMDTDQEADHEPHREQAMRGQLSEFIRDPDRTTY
jgi:hypothetical protein